MVDTEENAIIVNALQRHAAVIVQKSLAEGFGLTVAEALATDRRRQRRGGIQDQIVDGQSGLLLPDPTDLAAFTRLLADIVPDERRRAAIGERARQRVIDRFLPDRQLQAWCAVLEATARVR